MRIKGEKERYPLAWSRGIHKICPTSSVHTTEGVIKLSGEHGRKHIKKPDTNPLLVYPSERIYLILYLYLPYEKWNTERFVLASPSKKRTVISRFWCRDLWLLDSCIHFENVQVCRLLNSCNKLKIFLHKNANSNSA